ncbi:MAG: RsmG family class I SAM-dependent methyltransferase [Candidatus Zixiibacteriota bacterium]
MTTELIRQFNSEDILDKYNIRVKINLFLDQLFDYNQKINLVSRETNRLDLIRICADSLVPFEFIGKPAGEFIDIGSGGGFPAIIILLTFPHLKGTLIERTAKKERFLVQAIREFMLDAVSLSQNFIEYSPTHSRNKFDFATMKLVKPDANVFTRLFSLLKDQGKFIYYAALDNIKFEIPNKLSSVEYRYYLDDSERLRNLTLFSKNM